MDDMGKFTASDDFSLGTNEDDGMGFDLFKDVLPKIPIVGGIEAAFEPHSTQGVAAALGAIHEDEGYGVAAPAPPRFGRRVAAALRTNATNGDRAAS